MSDFITLTGASNTPALIRVSAIVSVTQEDENRRVIEYVAGDKLLTMFVKDTVEDILASIKWEARDE